MVGPERPQFVLFGSSIVQYGFGNEGWGAILADLYARKVLRFIVIFSFLWSVSLLIDLQLACYNPFDDFSGTWIWNVSMFPLLFTNVDRIKIFVVLFNSRRELTVRFCWAERGLIISILVYDSIFALNLGDCWWWDPTFLNLNSPFNSILFYSFIWVRVSNRVRVQYFIIENSVFFFIYILKNKK